jgi:hypothetical protein
VAVLAITYRFHDSRVGSNPTLTALPADWERYTPLAFANNGVVRSSKRSPTTQYRHFGKRTETGDTRCVIEFPTQSTTYRPAPPELPHPCARLEPKMRSSLTIRRFQAKGGQSRITDTPEANSRQTQPPPHGLQGGNVSQSIRVFAQLDAPFISAPKITFRPHSEPKNAKTEKVKTRNEVNLTSEKYGVCDPSNEKTKKVFFPGEPNLTPAKSGSHRPAFLSRARPLTGPLYGDLSFATLLAYVSDPRRPASPSPPSGNVCVAGPGLIRFCKSNERMPAAVPAGFFIALSGLRS